MSYKAIVCRLSDVKPHPNADRLQIAHAIGYNVIVGLDARDGDLGVLFPTDGKLSNDMCMANNLYRKNPITGELMGGYLEANGRIKVVKLRGENSEGLFTSLSSLDWAGPNNLKEGDEFDTINGKVVCQKYYTPATIRAMKRAEKSYKKPWWLPRYFVPIHKKYFVKTKTGNKCPDFVKHFDTSKLRQVVHLIPPNLDVYFSEKFHGTSARSGYFKYDDRNLLKRLLRFPLEYKYVYGTRNVNYPPNKKDDTGYYSGTDFRRLAHEKVIKNGLKKEELIFYEIVGYADLDKKIMPDHTIQDSELKESGFSQKNIKEFRDEYGETISYTYGCENGEFDIYVYRITQNGKDLNYEEMVKRCDELDLKPTECIYHCKSDQDLMILSEKLSRLSSIKGQLSEGVCLRLEDNGEFKNIVKYKSFVFSLAEQIKKNTDTYIDLEEIS